MTPHFTQTPPRPERINPIDAGLLCCIFIALLLKCRLVFVLKIGWDEFFYLAKVLSYLRQELTAPFQTFHVHLFSWLPAVSPSEVSQVIAARISLFVLFTGSCYLVYLIGKQMLNRSGALFSVLCYVSLSNIVFHGAEFRADSICSFLFLLAVCLIVSFPRSRISSIVGGAVMALSLMVSIKVLFHLPAIGGIFICLLLMSDNRKQTVFQMVYFSAAFVIILSLLYLYHLSSLPAQPETGALEFAGQSGSKVIERHHLFPRLGYFVFSVVDNLVIWILFFIGFAMISWNGLRHKTWLFYGKKSLLLYPFLIPLLTLLFYRNAFPYFYVFIMAPAIVFCGVVMHHISEDFKAGKKGAILFFAGIFSVAVFSSFLFHYSKASPAQLTAQKKIIQTVHQIFPDPVPYIDGCSAIASFPKAGFFMSTWGMETYLKSGRPVMRHLLEKRQPVFLLANLPSLDFSLPRENRFTEVNHALLEEDWQVLKSNFIPHWGLIYVAGKQFELNQQTWRHEFEILIPGTYTVETKTPVNIDGTVREPGSAAFLDRGIHTVSLPVPGNLSVTLRWGENLYRPEDSPEVLPVFYGF